MLNRLVHFPIKSLPFPQIGRVFEMAVPFSTFSSQQGRSNEFITVPQDKIQFEINRYKAVGGKHFSRFLLFSGNASPTDISSRIVVSFNVMEAEWMPEYSSSSRFTSRRVKKVFMQQQALHIDENGVFHLVSSLHRSLTANRVEIMRKLQKKVNQACISTLDQHKIGSKGEIDLTIGLNCSCRSLCKRETTQRKKETR